MDIEAKKCNEKPVQKRKKPFKISWKMFAFKTILAILEILRNKIV